MSRSIRSKSPRARTPVRRVRQPWRWLPFRFRLLLARVKTHWLHRRVIRRLLVFALVGVVAVVLSGASARAQSIQERWGHTTNVVVATGPIDVGDDAESHDFRIESRPAAFVSSDALESAPGEDESFIRPIEAGEVVSQRDLRSYRSAMMPAGTRAVSVPLDLLVPSLQVGDSIELIVVPDVFDDRQENVRSQGIVIDLDDGAATVAVPSGDVTALARALVTGQVVVARQ